MTTYDDDLWAGTDTTPSPANPFDPNDHPDEWAAWEKQAAADRAEEKRIRDELALTRATTAETLRLRAQNAARELVAAETAEKAKQAAADSTRVRTGGTFLLDVPELPPALWGHNENILWARGEALLIAGPQGTGKTTLAGQLLRATLGLGTRQLLDLPVTPSARRVLYLAMDRPKQTQRALGRMFHPEERDYLDEVLRFWVGPPPADVAANPQTLLTLALEHDADTVFIDSLKDAAVGLAKDEVGAGYNRARQLCLAEGVEMVELHHMVKNSPDGRAPRHLKDIFGSTWITAGVGSVMLLWGEAGDPIIELHHLKQPMAEVGPHHLRHDRTTGGVNIFHDPDADVIALARSKGRAGINARDAAAATYSVDKPTKAQVEKTRRKLAEYVEKGLLIHQPGSSGQGGRGAADRWLAAVPQRLRDQEPEREWYR